MNGPHDSFAFRWTESNGITTIAAGHDDARGWDVSADGNTIVGRVDDQPFVWTDDSGLRTLDVPAHWDNGTAFTITPDGTTVVGTYYVESNGVRNSDVFMFTNDEEPISLGHPEGWSVVDPRVSDNGKVITWRGSHPALPTTAFAWTERWGVRDFGELLREDFGLADSLAGWELNTILGVSADGTVFAGHGTNPTGHREAWIASLRHERPIDFDRNDTIDAHDVDQLVNAIVAGGVDLTFDLTGDEFIDDMDLAQWLSDAATENGFDSPYLYGDANLDGTVNAFDLNALGQNWLGQPNTWQMGDFNADGTVNAGDLNDIGQNWLATIQPAAASQSVPEPATAYLFILVILTLAYKIRLK